MVLSLCVAPFYIIRKNICDWSVIHISVKILEVPVWEKSNLTVEETAAYSGIGINKIKELSNDEDCPFVLWVGAKRLIKRKKFDDYIERQFSI